MKIINLEVDFQKALQTGQRDHMGNVTLYPKFSLRQRFLLIMNPKMRLHIYHLLPESAVIPAVGVPTEQP